MILGKKSQRNLKLRFLFPMTYCSWTLENWDFFIKVFNFFQKLFSQSFKFQVFFPETLFPVTFLHRFFCTSKNVRQGKSIAVVYTLRTFETTLRTFETSSLWTEFVNNNRCISVRLVSEEVKSIKF